MPGEDDVFLRGKIVEEAATRNIRGGRDVVERGRLKAALEEQCHGHPGQPLAGLLPPALPRAGRARQRSLAGFLLWYPGLNLSAHAHLMILNSHLLQTCTKCTFTVAWLTSQTNRAGDISMTDWTTADIPPWWCSPVATTPRVGMRSRASKLKFPMPKSVMKRSTWQALLPWPNSLRASLPLTPRSIF